MTDSDGSTLLMVKKRLENGEPCNKCRQAEEILRSRGLYERIDEIVWAEECDPLSPGMKLGAELGVEAAPFFIVKKASGEQRVYSSVLKFIQAIAPPKVPSRYQELDARAIEAVERELAPKSPKEILEWGLRHYGDSCVLAFGGADDVVLIDMAAKSGLSFSVLCLDTGRLHPETYRFIDRVRGHYGIEIQLLLPDAKLLEPMIRKKGLFSFYEDGHHECCGIRKVEPLKRGLAAYRAWVTGQRRDQSPVTRGDLAVVELDSQHVGAVGPLVKLNPLASFSSKQIWEYIRIEEVPYNALHERGFVSIGCEPCTRAIRPGEHERAGRWWWEEETKRECGLHPGKR